MTRARQRGLWCGLLLALFVAAGTVRYWNTRGDDLGSSYIGCRVLSAGEAPALYSYDPEEFSDINPHDKAWHEQAKTGHYNTFLHPYVQTPLWAWSLLPLCEHTNWMTFNRAFVILSLTSMAGIVALVAWAWTPFFLEPIPLAILLVGLSLSQPFEYAMFLTQTHALYMVLVVAGFVLAERRWEWTGGVLVALAAAVKLTPAALVVYWIATRRWRAATGLVLWSIALMVLTWVILRTALVKTYLVNLHRVSDVLLLAENNQSFAAWLMGPFYPRAEVFDFTPFPLPTRLRLGSDALLALGTMAGGLLDRRANPSGVSRTPRFGVGVALLASTLFAPIAWTHYFILLVIPIMLLVEAIRRLKGRWTFAIGTVTVFAAGLNFRPFAADVWTFTLSGTALLRGQFFAGMLCLVGLGMAWWAERRSLATQAVGDRRMAKLVAIGRAEREQDAKDRPAAA